MDDWDSVSNDTSPDSATNPWDAVSTPEPSPNSSRRRPALPDNLIVPDAPQSDDLPGQGTSMVQSLQASPPQDHSATPLSQTDRETSVFTDSSYTPVSAPSVRRTALIIVSIAVALVLVIGGFGVFQGLSNYNAGVAANATAQAEATASANATVTAQAVATATATASIIPSPPTITSVSQFLPTQTQTITISGSGFGTHAPFTNRTSDYLLVADTTIKWGAGYGGDWVTVNVSVWTDSQIVITGFSGSYGTDGFVFSAGDAVTISVWNPQSGAGPAQFPLIVAS